MKRTLLLSAALMMGVTSATMLAPIANATVSPPECTPSITMEQPFQRANGYIHFPATYTTCDAATITWKIRDRRFQGWSGSSVGSTVPMSKTAGPSLCSSDGRNQRYVAYATIKTFDAPRQLIAYSQKVYFKSADETYTCSAS